MDCPLQGAAFGFSTIATQAGEQLAPYMSQIVPRLYRYQFDPNPRIQQAMSGIWSALVKDNKKTVSGRFFSSCSLVFWVGFFFFFKAGYLHTHKNNFKCQSRLHRTLHAHMRKNEK